MCFGNITDKIAECKCSTFEQHMNHILDIFWNTNFSSYGNGDLLTGDELYRDVMATLRDNPKMKIQDKQFIKRNKSVNDAIKSLCGSQLYSESD